MGKLGRGFLAFFLISLATEVFASASLYVSEGQSFRVEYLFKRNDVIWGFDFLSESQIIFSERGGKLFVWDLKAKAADEISGVPKVWAQGQGGLLDVRRHPTKLDLIYFTYAKPEGDGATTALASAQLADKKLVSIKTLFSAVEANDENVHFGSRIEFDGKGHIFITVGDRNNRSHVQDLKFHTGKIIRLKEDGSTPSDNPFVSVSGAKPEIWSLGHRSPQGLVLNKLTGDLWMAEMGPRGGDEINLLRAKGNYGWPVITYGREYWGPKIGEGTKKEGMEQPIAYWVPSISPSAMTFYTGAAFPKWKGHAFLATLSGRHLRRLVIENRVVVKQESLLEDLGYRFRNVREGQDGLLYFSTDDGRLARLVPARPDQKSQLDK